MDDGGYQPGVTSQQTVTMLKFRQDLEAAIWKTLFRKKVQDSLENLCARLKNGGKVHLKQAGAIMCLLAIELHWVKLPPLDSKECRKHLVKIAQIVLEKTDSEKILQHATIVLRSTGKRDFAEVLPKLVERFLDRPLLLKQILYDIFTLLEQPYHQHEYTLMPIKESLKSCLEIVKPRSQTGNDEFGQIYTSLQALYTLASRKLAFANRSDNTSITEAWIELKATLAEQFQDAHRELPLANQNLYYGSLEKMWEDVGEPIGEISFWKAAKDNWFRCQLLLEEKVLVRVRETWDIFQGSHATGYIPETDRELLKEMSFDSSRMYQFNDLLYKFSNTPPDSMGNDWETFKAIRWQLGRVLLKFPENENNGSLLYKFTQGCPVDLVKKTQEYAVMSRLQQEADISCHCEQRELPVFCHETLLNEIFNELFDNAIIVHKRPDLEGKVTISITTLFLQDDNKVTLRFVNKGSDPQFTDRYNTQGSGGKYGLKKLQKALVPYKGEISHESSPSNDWDYETKVTFLFCS